MAVALAVALALALGAVFASSLRDSGGSGDANPQAEAWGYFRWSLRDENRESPSELSVGVICWTARLRTSRRTAAGCRHAGTVSYEAISGI